MHLVIGVEDDGDDFLLQQAQIDLEIVIVAADELRIYHLRFVDVLVVVVVLKHGKDFLDT